MDTNLLVLIVVILLLVGAFPTFPHSRGWGYGPFGLIAVILIVLLLVRLI